MRFGLSAALITLLAAPVSAGGPFDQFKVGNWHAGAYTNDTTKRFSHCAAFTMYRSNISFFVSVTRDYEWGLGFSHPQWNLTPGQTMPINLTFDDSGVFRVVGRVVNPNFVLIPMPSDSSLVRAFRAGRFMTAFARNEQFTFKLDGTARLLPQLVQCVERSLNPPGVSSNSLPRQAPQAQSNTAARNDSEIEKDRLLTEAAAEHKKCTQTQMRQIVPYSGESAETLAQVILTNCSEAEEKFIRLGVALFNNTRADVERSVRTALSDQKKRMVAEIVTFRAEVAKALMEESRRDRSAPATNRPGI
jgi:hypothetical protein